MRKGYTSTNDELLQTSARNLCAKRANANTNIIPSFTLAQLLRSVTSEIQILCSLFFIMKINSADTFIAVAVYVFFSSSFFESSWVFSQFPN